MNEAGLSAALLWDEGHLGYGKYLPNATNSSSAKEPIVYFDLATRVLADCDSIACAKQLINSLQIVDTKLTQDISFEITGELYLPLHPTFCDKTGHCFALEWVSMGNPVIYDLPRGVLTNQPHVPEQERLYEAYKNMSQLTYDPSKTNVSWLVNWPGGTAGYDMSSIGENTTGILEPSSRYIRMAMMLEFYGPVPYAPDSPVSPGNYSSQLAAFVQINGILNYAAEMGAAPDAPPMPIDYDWYQEMSHYITTRDHIRGQYYVRTAWNTNQHRINVKQQASGHKIKRQYLDVALPANQFAKTIRF